MKQTLFGQKRFSLFQLLLTILLTLVVVLGILAAVFWQVLGKGGLTLLEGLSLVNTCFVGEYDEDTVVDAAMDAMIEATGDRWSYYLTAEQYASEQERRSNSYVGIGVTVTYESEDGLTILAVAEGGPAAETGLKAGELITAVDGQSISGDARYDATGLIQGEEGTTVVLTVRDTAGAQREVTVERRSIETDPVRYELLEGGVGYVKLTNFFARSAERVEEAVTDLQEQGATALVFDMRNNGGGYLDELTEMLDFLVDEGPILRTRSYTGKEDVVESDADCVDLPMAVLVNADTYSAAEIFAGELRERGVAVVVGVPTSGKGYSQQTFPLPNGGAAGISTAEYFTGEGVSLIGTGLTLDREVELTDEQAALLAADALDYADDPQLQAALELLEPGA